MSNGDSDKKYYHRKWNVSVSNSIVKTDEDQDNNFDIKSIDHLDAVMIVNKFNIRNKRSRTTILKQTKNQGQKVLWKESQKHSNIYMIYILDSQILLFANQNFRITCNYKFIFSFQ